MRKKKSKKECEKIAKNPAIDFMMFCLLFLFCFLFAFFCFFIAFLLLFDLLFFFQVAFLFYIFLTFFSQINDVEVYRILADWLT